MQMSKLKCLVVFGVLCAVTACSPRVELKPTAITGGADEFGIVPNKPLESPTNFATLPTPTLGGSNLTDVTPKANAIAALGGRLPTSGVDGGIVNYASRYGVDASIRSALSQDDAKFLKRKANGLKWPFSSNKYERAYKRLALDPIAEQARLRALGVLVPTVPSSGK
jgi:hypothetical protein